jgi:hypothetical protein
VTEQIIKSESLKQETISRHNRSLYPWDEKSSASDYWLKLLAPSKVTNKSERDTNDDYDPTVAPITKEMFVLRFIIGTNVNP